MKTVGLLISGIGFNRGTSVWDVSYVLKELERCNAKPIPIAPREGIEKNIPGPRRKSEPKRNYLNEAKMMVRGEVYYLDQIDSNDLDTLIIPGGRGAVTVFSSLLRDGTETQFLPELRELVISFFFRNKYIASIGYGGALLAVLLRNITEPILTIGEDVEIIEVLKKMGADVLKVKPDEVILDEKSKIISTPGTSPNSSLYKACKGIEILIDELFKYNEIPNKSYA